MQTRKQEISEKDYSNLSEDEKRFYQRNLTKKGNYSLNQVAKKVSVKNFDKFHNAGYKGLYNGETANAIAKRKGLRYREDILDNMGSEELADNLFRIVRKTIKEAGGTMPEDLSTPKKSLKQIEKEEKINLLKNRKWLYDVETKEINQAIKNNLEKFLERFS